MPSLCLCEFLQILQVPPILQRPAGKYLGSCLNLPLYLYDVGTLDHKLLEGGDREALQKVGGAIQIPIINK